MPEGPSFHHKKSLGQNFLSDRGILLAICRLAGLGEQDVVLEIGAGKGALTLALLESPCRLLYSVEIDRSLEPFLQDISLLHPGRLMMIWEDALSISFRSLAPVPTKVVANIPYNITTPLLWHLLKELAPAGTESFLVMVQKEAAERLMAPAGTRRRSPLGVTLEAMGTLRSVLQVQAGAFRPRPSVDSSVLSFRPRDERRNLPDDPFWMDLLRAAFLQRRKKLVNKRRARDGTRPWERFLEEAGIGANERAEEVSSSAWLVLREFFREGRAQKKASS